MLAGPFVVFAAADDEFHFVALGEVLDVAPQIARTFAGGRRLQIHNAVNPRVDLRDVMCAAGFDEHGLPCVAELGHQREYVFFAGGARRR